MDATASSTPSTKPATIVDTVQGSIEPLRPHYEGTASLGLFARDHPTSDNAAPRTSSTWLLQRGGRGLVPQLATTVPHSATRRLERHHADEPIGSSTPHATQPHLSRSLTMPSAVIYHGVCF